MLGWVWDPERRRARAAVRIGAHLGLLGALLFAVSALGRVVPSTVLGPIAFAGVVLVTHFAARVLDRRAFTDLGLRVDDERARDFAAGAVIGGGSIGLVALAESSLGVCRYAPLPYDTERAVSLALVAVFFVSVAIQEELVFRGYHLVNLTEGLEGPRVPRQRAAVAATLLSALGFGLAHAGNDGATVLSTLQVALAGCTLLAVGFVLTGDLAFSIGVHFAWNFTQAACGMPVSGFVLERAALITRTPVGDPLLTGGAFGPEASVIGLTAMLVGTAAALAWVRWRYGSLEVRLRTAPPPVGQRE